MNRREFSTTVLLAGLGAHTGLAAGADPDASGRESNVYREPPKDLPVRRYDVVVAGAGTAGVLAALAAARRGAKTALIERKGYPGGTVTEGGTALHSFYNLWKPFPGVEKRQVVRGIPQEIIDRLARIGGTSGHAEMDRRFDYDSVCTAIDTELYKLVTFEMLAEAGVDVCVNSLVAGAVRDGDRVRGAIVESRSGREVFLAKAFVDCTAYGDLAAFSGAEYTVPNDYASCNSIGMGNVDVEKYFKFLWDNDALSDYAEGKRSGQDGMIVRLNGGLAKLPAGFREEAGKIGMSMTTTTVHDNYFMFIKVNLKVPGTVLSRDDMARAELEVRKRQFRAVELFREYVPGCEKAFMARTSPSLNIRRGRLIRCDYDISHEDVIEARHFDDDVFVYGFHDSAPRFQVGKGETYGFPYRALCVAGLDNLFVSGMMITSDHRAHMSTRNTVSCMGQGQATGTAAALCAARRLGSRDLPYADLRRTLVEDGVYFEDAG